MPAAKSFIEQEILFAENIPNENCHIQPDTSFAAYTEQPYQS
jgi:hypothetical protein